MINYVKRISTLDAKPSCTEETLKEVAACHGTKAAEMQWVQKQQRHEETLEGLTLHGRARAGKERRRRRVTKTVEDEGENAVV